MCVAKWLALICEIWADVIIIIITAGSACAMPPSLIPLAQGKTSQHLRWLLCWPVFPEWLKWAEALWIRNKPLFFQYLMLGFFVIIAQFKPIWTEVLCIYQIFRYQLVLVLSHKSKICETARAKKRSTRFNRVVRINFRFNLTKLICAYHLQFHVCQFICASFILLIIPAEKRNLKPREYKWLV